MVSDTASTVARRTVEEVCGPFWGWLTPDVRDRILEAAIACYLRGYDDGLEDYPQVAKPSWGT